MRALSQNPMDNAIIFIEATEVDELLECFAFDVTTVGTRQYQSTSMCLRPNESKKRRLTQYTSSSYL
jgi:hypothetical protein